MSNSVMYDTVMIDMLAQIYFITLEKEGDVPSVPGLALALGFNRSHDIIKTLTSYDAGLSPYPEESVIILIRSVTKIEEAYIQGGMKDKFPIALIKFCLGAYHNLQEKETQGNKIENQNIQIVFEAPKVAQNSLEGINPFQQMAQAQPVIELRAEAI